jgi:hypothetical protein
MECWGSVFLDYTMHGSAFYKDSLANQNFEHDHSSIGFVVQSKIPFIPYDYSYQSYDIVDDVIKNLRRYQYNNSAICVGTNHHAKALVGHKQQDDKLLFVYADPYGTPIDSALKQKLEDQGEVIDLNLRVQSDGNSCGAYTIDLIEIIVLALKDGKISKDQIKDFIKESGKNWERNSVRAEQYKKIYNEYPTWYTLTLQPTPTHAGDQTPTPTSTPIPEQMLTPTQVPGPTLTHVPVPAPTQVPTLTPTPKPTPIITPEQKIEQEEILKMEVAEAKQDVLEQGEIKVVTPEVATNFEKKAEAIKQQLSEAKTSNNTVSINVLEQEQKKNEAFVIIYQEAQKYVMQLVLQEVTNVILSRISSVTAPQPIAFGFASGSPFENYGFWGQGFGGFSTQKENANNDAFEAKAMGFAAGFDIGNENGLLGISYNFASSDLMFKKVKDQNLTNKNINHLFSLYSSYLPSTKAQISGQIGGGFGDLELQDKTQKQGRIFFGSVEGRYYFDISEKINLFPKVGFEMFKASYSGEKDSFKVDSSRGLGIWGLGVRGSIVNGDLVISPELLFASEMMLFGDEKKVAPKANIPLKAEGGKDLGGEKITFVTEGKVDLTMSSKFKASVGMNYHMRKDFSSLGGFMKLSVHF